jgi:hypothetical protein
LAPWSIAQTSSLLKTTGSFFGSHKKVGDKS